MSVVNGQQEESCRCSRFHPSVLGCFFLESYFFGPCSSLLHVKRNNPFISLGLCILSSGYMVKFPRTVVYADDIKGIFLVGKFHSFYVYHITKSFKFAYLFRNTMWKDSSSCQCCIWRQEQGEVWAWWNNSLPVSWRISGHWSPWNFLQKGKLVNTTILWRYRLYF